MEQQLKILASDGKESFFDIASKVNVDQNRLLVSIETPQGSAGWHWDRFAALVQTTDVASGTPDSRTFEATLRFEDGDKLVINVPSVQPTDVASIGNLIKVKGSSISVLINTDYLEWYQI
ncbi:MAG: hypothetical protein GY729_11415 [Desulfobacteraceae bacterium]|nr:hypothetical protein [Desulfobacteraceae bacterium]